MYMYLDTLSLADLIQILIPFLQYVASLTLGLKGNALWRGIVVRKVLKKTPTHLQKLEPSVGVDFTNLVFHLRDVKTEEYNVNKF